MTKASDNEYPSLLVKEGTAPASPASGDQRLFIDSADHLLKVKDSAGTVTAVGSGSAPTFHGCRVKDTSGQSIANNTLVALAMAGTEDYDSDAYHDTSTNNSRITVPASLGGKYRIGGTATLATANAGTERLLAVRLNGSTYIAINSAQGASNGANEEYVSIATEYALSVGDYVELIYRQQTGGAASLATNASYGCIFWASLIA